MIKSKAIRNSAKGQHTAFELADLRAKGEITGVKEAFHAVEKKRLSEELASHKERPVNYELWWDWPIKMITFGFWRGLKPRIFGKRFYDKSGSYELIGYRYCGKLYITKYGLR